MFTMCIYQYVGSGALSGVMRDLGLLKIIWGL